MPHPDDRSGASPDASFNSTSDQRVSNNLMRHQYRVLGDVEKQQMQRLKDLGLEFVALLHEVGGTSDELARSGEAAKLASRELSLAQKNLEQAVFWAVKHITR